MGDFRSRLRRRETLIGSLVTLNSPQVAELYALAGLDWVWIDLEHTPLTLDQA